MKRATDLTWIAPIFQAMLDQVITDGEMSGHAERMNDATDVYNDSFMLSQIIDDVTLEELAGLNIQRTVEYYAMRQHLGPFGGRSIREVLQENIDYFYDVNGSTYEQDIIYNLAQRIGYAPEAFRYTLKEELSDTGAYYYIETTYQERILWNGHYKYDYMTDEMSVLGEGMIDWVASDWSLGLYDKYGVSE
ncbi:hypothetical protein CL176_03250 [Suicoccus acidiformans]|uniref:Uncharacterized protein n=1 Tax=Suicoccus acidiformans TaxID=2036206 RepID=A0A347WJ67_9LACT|nr:hypothetical protein [Suicoccus acidiformans]AXY25124.1 hypothetical protein CL176_03250 [Suicoccus acidiformans]